MTSKIKVDNINKVSDDSTIIKKCGTTTTVGSGSGQTIVIDGATVTLGRCGGAVNLAPGATQTGFGRTGTVDWQTTPKTATFTAVSGEGYFANTSGSAFNMNLPAGVAGAIVSVADYAESFDSNNLTVVPNGTDKIGAINENAVLSTKGQSVTFVFVDSTQGWINTMDSTSNVRGTPPYIAASGGNTTITCGNFKIHVFTGPGTFCVSNAGGASGSNSVEYLVVAGGGSGGFGDPNGGGGGGAGGWRSRTDLTPASPLNAPAKLPVSVQGYPITVGAGGAQAGGNGNDGNNSVFSTITSAKGGGGGYSSGTVGHPGGSGGGSPNGQAGGSGNTPPTAPPQGSDGGDGAPNGPAGGGGGASAAGQDAAPSYAGDGGDGAFITGPFFGPTAPSYGQAPSPLAPNGRYFSGGGGGGPPVGGGGVGGAGGGAASSSSATIRAGTANTGGGGGGNWSGDGGAGGSGIVFIRYRFQ